MAIHFPLQHGITELHFLGLDAVLLAPTTIARLDLVAAEYNGSSVDSS